MIGLRLPMPMLKVMFSGCRWKAATVGMRICRAISSPRRQKRKGRIKMHDVRLAERLVIGFFVRLREAEALLFHQRLKERDCVHRRADLVLRRFASRQDGDPVARGGGAVRRSGAR